MSKVIHSSTKESYTSLNLPPLGEPRSIINIGYLVFFLILVILYVGISIHAFSNGDVNKFQKSNFNGGNSKTLKILDKFYDIKWFFLSILYVAMLSTILSSYAIRLLPGVLVRVAVVCECFNLGIIFLYIHNLLFQLELITFKNHFLAITVLTYFCIAKLYVVSKVGTKLTCDIVKESHSIIDQPLTLVTLSLVISSLVFFVILFASFVYVHLSSIRLNNAVPLYIYAFHVINMYTTMQSCFYLFYFGQMVLHGTFASRYWTMDKKNSPYRSISKNFFKIIRYHLGTIAYKTSFWIMFAAAYFIIKDLNISLHVFRQIFFHRLRNFWNTYCKFFESSIGVYAIQRKKVDEAADIVCQLYMRNPLQVLAISKAFEGLAIILASVLGIFIALGISSFYFFHHITSIQFSIATLVVVTSLLIITLPLIIIFNAIICTIFCILEGNDEDQEHE